MRAADIMSRSVIAVSRDAPLAQAIRLMVDNRISGLPVIDPQGRPVGILTEGDLLRRVEAGTEGGAAGWFASFFMPGRVARRYVQAHSRRVSDIMTADVISVAEDAPLSDVVALMQRKRIKRLPVVRGEMVVGIISRADLVRMIGDALAKPATTADDAAIWEAIRGRVDRQTWVPRKGIAFAVENGVVLLDGCLSDCRQRHAIGVLVENVPGVKRVENRITCIEPNSGSVIYDPDDEVGPGGCRAVLRPSRTPARHRH